MAIKVNGTTVINDSRALQNIASLDSTTLTTLGNAGLGGVDTGATTPSDASGSAGDLFFNTTDETLYGHNGTSWKEIKAIPEQTDVYFNRSLSTGTASTNQPASVNQGGGWTHAGANCDGIQINLSGSGTYKLLALSFCGWKSTAGTVTASLRVTQGSTLGGTLVTQQTVAGTLLQTVSSSGYNEMPLTTPVTLNRGSSYCVAIAIDTNYGADTYSISSYDTNIPYGTESLTISNISSFNGPAPYNTDNGTSSTGGQIPVIKLGIT